MQRKPFSFLLITSLISLSILGSLLLQARASVSSKSAEPPIYLPMVHRSSGQVGLPPADEAANRIDLPAGFEIRIFAQNLARPRLMSVGPDGAVYVALYNSGQIARLPDRNRDGLADGVEIAASGLTQPHNMEWRDGAMYVAETGRVERLTDTNSDGVYETRALVTDNIPGSGGHDTRTMHFGPDGKLYVSAGSTSNITPENDPRRAAILRFNPDGSIPSDNPFASDADERRRAVWATGLRNSVDFLWTPQGALWANHNGSDWLGDDLPPEEVVIPVQKGRSHGWPYCYTAVLGLNVPPQPEVRDTRIPLPPGFTCDQAVPATLTVAAHSAPLGMTWGARSAFPAEYQDDIFVALHGSWNVNNPNSYRDCKVERIIVQNGAVTGSETFATGWRPSGATCGDAATWGRPAGVTIGADGALYISDDKSGRVYRVVYTGQ